MSAASILTFWGVSLLFVVTPGADWAYAMTAGLSHRSVVPAVLGLLCGHLAATAAVAAGIAAVLAGVPVALQLLTVAGAAYLAWLGVGMLLTPPAPDAGGGRAGADRAGSVGGGSGAVALAPSPLRRAATGAGVSGLNPKVLLLFLALLPQFVVPGSPWPAPLQILCLGLVHIVSCAVVYSVVGVAARKVLGARPAARRAVTRFSGTAMIVIAAVLLAEQLLP